MGTMEKGRPVFYDDGLGDGEACRLRSCGMRGPVHRISLWL